MSGGAFNYVCFRETIELIERKSELYEIIDSLVQYGYEDLAEDVKELIQRINKLKEKVNDVERYRETLEPILKAVEWYESGDYGKDTMIKVFEEYIKSKK